MHPQKILPPSLLSSQRSHDRETERAVAPACFLPYILTPLHKTIARALATRGCDVRKCSAGDEDFLFRLYCSTRRGEIATWGWDEAMAAEFLLLQFKAQSTSYNIQFPGAESFIIEQDHIAIGRIFVLESATEIRLVDVALLPQYQRQGIGTCIVESLKTRAQARALPVALSVQSLNPARNLYLRMGFKETYNDGMYVGMQWSPA